MFSTISKKPVQLVEGIDDLNNIKFDIKSLHEVLSRSNKKYKKIILFIGG